MFRTNKIFFTLLFLILGALYFDLITEEKLVNPDARHILENLEKLSTPQAYAYALINLKTIDFQPVRDVTFYFDLFFFNQFKINTFVLQNVFWWIACCWMMLKFLRIRYSSKFSDLTLIFLVLAFSVYPLFFHVIAWGIARKHIMSFCFSLCAIYLFIKKDRFRYFDLFLLTTYYLLSILSQPISILLPFWFLLFNALEKKKSFYLGLKETSPLFLIFGVVTYYNFNYYKLSPIFNFIYNSKTAHSFNISDKLLALGHYTYQVVFPYSFSFFYHLGDSRVLFGLGIMTIFILLIYLKKIRVKNIFLWITLGSSYLVVILNSPHMLYDTYLLMVVFSLFVVALDFLPRINERKLKSVCLVLIIFWFLLSIKESSLWKSRITFAKMSFDRTPHCRSALNYLKVSYEEDIPPTEELKKFNIDYLCRYDLNQTPSFNLTRIQLIANVFFYDDSYSADQRIKQLKDISKYYFVGRLNLAALYVKLGFENEANVIISEIIQKINSFSKPPIEYNAVTSKYIFPYCKTKKWDECLKVFTPMSIKKNTPYL